MNFLNKTIQTIRREGLRSTRDKAINRITAWNQSRKIDLEKQEERWCILKISIRINVYLL